MFYSVKLIQFLLLSAYYTRVCASVLTISKYTGSSTVSDFVYMIRNLDPTLKETCCSFSAILEWEGV